MGSVSAGIVGLVSRAADMLLWGLSVLRIPEFVCRRSPRDVILMYHSVGSELPDYQYNVDPVSFAQQIAFLVTHYAAVSLADILNTPNQGRTRVAVTFDDGFLNFYTEVFPVIENYRVPVTNFVPTSFIEGEQFMINGLEHLTWAQMREMADTGLVCFESHSHTHRHAVAHTPSGLRSDLLRSRTLIEDNLRYVPKYFAYPGGKCNSQTHQIALECGFERLLTSHKSFVSDELAVGRISIEDYHHLYTFRAELAALTTTVDELRKTVLSVMRPLKQLMRMS